MSVFDHEEFKGHEQVVFAHDEATGLRAIIAVHNTSLGPAVGGCRMYPYADDATAVTDVLRLSRGMTYKSALAGLPFGGGKSVIMGDPRHEKSPELMRAMGRAVDRLGGAYVLAEDSGTSPIDMRHAAKETQHVSGLEENVHGGDPSPATAYGVFLGIQAGVEQAYRTRDLSGLRVAVQGLGNVGYHLVGHLTRAGAIVFGTDIHEPNVTRAARDFGMAELLPEEIMEADCDVFAPCALGAVLNTHTIPRLRARVVAGAANNQLATDEDDERLLERGITYCPDFAINAGGIIEVYHQKMASPDYVRADASERIGETVSAILNRAQETGVATQRVAIDMAESDLAGDLAGAPSQALKATA